jgi:hypothetical protein
MALNSFSAIRAPKKLFANVTVTRSNTTIALVKITVEIAGLTALLSFLKELDEETLSLVMFPPIQIL